jgi:hypothetical protein
MYLPFDQLSDQAPIWIYQADEPMSDAQVDAVMQRTNVFLANWTSHGRPLQGGAVIKENIFLVVGIEKPTHNLSCCTIDSVIHLLHELRVDLRINFLNRDRVIFKQGEQILAVPISQVKKKIQQGELTSDTLMFDNTITDKADLVDKWLVPIKNSWLK